MPAARSSIIDQHDRPGHAEYWIVTAGCSRALNPLGLSQRKTPGEIPGGQPLDAASRASRLVSWRYRFREHWRGFVSPELKRQPGEHGGVVLEIIAVPAVGVCPYTQGDRAKIVADKPAKA